MIRFLTLHLIFPAALAQIDKRPVVHLPKDLGDLMAKTTYDCMLIFRTPSSAIKHLYELKFPDDEVTKQFLFCVCYTTYLADENGHLTETMLRLFDDSDYEEDVKKVFESCNKIKRRKSIRTLYDVVKCFHENSPVILGPPLIRY
ncbi:uncharacterized protein LOC106714352 [Papilio machaon]|uniref:uncharacterized protein LOC106714352 n=1 Tax=Papilio machaon TaxID=76193 RepID=UPI001E66328B|nr:uncharacterized protein LOC106714352 [Papilio machaon]